jgi:hypothetical protein
MVDLGDEATRRARCWTFDQERLTPGLAAVRLSRQVTKAFVSYARCEKVFVVHLVHELQQRGVAAWSDSTLSLGDNWRAAIAEALARCDALVLVATQDALASPYCQQEWRTARACGKPVVLAAIERVRVPSELNGAAVIDMRRSPDDAMAQLAGVLEGSVRVLPRARPRLPAVVLTRSRWPAALLLAFLLIYQLVMFADTVDFVREPLQGETIDFVGAGPHQVLAGGALLAYLHLLILGTWIAFSVRWSYRWLCGRVAGARIFAGVVFVPSGWLLHSVLESRPLWWIWVAFAAFGVLFATACASDRLEPPPWAAPIRPRRRHRRRGRRGRTPVPARSQTLADVVADQPQAAAHLPVPGTYRLYAAAQDALIARPVQEAMAHNGHRTAPSGVAPAVQLVLLSNATDLSATPLAAAPDPRVLTVCVVAYGIAVPEGLKAFHGFQWLDHRTTDDRKLDRLAAWLKNPTAISGVGLGSDEPAHRIDLSGDVGTNTFFMTFLAVVFGLFPLVGLLDSVTIPDHDPPRAVTVSISMAASLAAALTAAITRARAVTFAGFCAAYMCAGALSVAALAAMVADPGLVAVLVVFPWFLWIDRAGLSVWFLATPLSWRRPTLASESIGRAVLRYVLITLTITVAISVIIASTNGLTGAIG